LSITVQAEGLTRRYGEKTALEEVSFAVQGGICGILGPNGAGKTTLLRMLASILPPSAGRAVVGGEDVRARPNRVRRLIGYLPQEFGVYRCFSAHEFLDYMALLKGIDDRGERRRQIGEVLRRVHLDTGYQRAGTFSGGMKQRLGIAQALLGDPPLLIVDEPTAGLDPGERASFRGLLAEVSATRTVLLSTHIVADVEETAGRIMVLGGGRLLFLGSPEKLISSCEGLVWELTAGARDLSDLRARLTVLRVERRGADVAVRLTAREKPDPAAQPCRPTLEDAYLCLTREAEGDLT